MSAIDAIPLWIVIAVKSALLLFVVITTFAYAMLFERKVMAWMQLRPGPNRVGPWGMMQPAADAAKVVAEASHGRPVVVHYWASWCEACLDEFEHLGPTLLALPEQGVSVLLVSIDAPKDVELARALLERFGLAELPSVLLDAPSPDPVAKAMGERSWTGSLPATLDRKSVV